MEQVTNKQVVFKDYINGFPKESDMLLKSSSTICLKLPQGSNGVLVKNLYLSCDPYMRARMTKTEGSYIDSFTPGSVTGRVKTEYEALMETINNFIMSKEVHDKWCFSLSSDVSFSVRECRRILEDSSQVVQQVVQQPETFWSRLVPKKICVFAWRVDRHRLPVRPNLVKRGIDIPSVLCPWCNNHTESVIHALFTCKEIVTIWKEIHTWWGIDYKGGESFEELNTAASDKLSSKNLKIWNLVTRSTAYVIWRLRNEKNFGDQRNKLWKAADQVKVLLFQWLQARAKTNSNLTWRDWLLGPKIVAIKGK